MRTLSQKIIYFIPLFIFSANTLAKDTLAPKPVALAPVEKTSPKTAKPESTSDNQLWRELSEEQAKKRSLNIPSWAPLVEASQPAVVVITTEAVVEQPPLEVPGGGPFRFFMPVPPENKHGQGSGFIFNPKGYIITNWHVIDGAQSIKVQVGLNPRQYKAKVIGSDEPLDIAILKIEEDEKISWPYLPLGDSDQVNLGDPIMALGSPLGLVQSVTVGIVSHKSRKDIRPSGHYLLAEVMQIQAPINPGNSGGPVLDDSGRVLGISQSMSASGQSIAFCLPINTIKSIMPELMKNGQIEQAFLGVEPTDLTPPYAEKLGLPMSETGAVLIQVMPNTPAEKAGLKPMDVILEIDGKKVSDAFNLRRQTAYTGVGHMVKLKVYRKGVGTKEYSIKLGKRPGQTTQVIKNEEQKLSSLTIESVGLEVSDTTASVRNELSLNSKNPGAQVMGIARRSSAELAALMPDDVILKVDGTAITSAKHLKNLIDNAPKEKPLMMIIRRGQIERFVSLVKK